MANNGNDNGNSNKNNNNNNNNKNKNKTPDFKYHSENKIYSVNGRKKDYFGYSLCLYDDTLVVGAYAASPIVQYSGAVYVFEKNASATRLRWNEIGTLVAAEAASHDSFGASVSVWKNTILVGAHLDDVSGTSSGAAYIFEKMNETWTQRQRIDAPDSTAGNFFGFNTALCDDIAVVGAHGWATGGSLVGAAYIFRKKLLSASSSVWQIEDKIAPSDVQEFQMFAYSLAAAPNVILVGAYGDRAFGTNTGSAYIFISETVTEGTGTNITTHTKWTQSVKLRASNPQAHSYFGISTAMYFDSRDPSLCIAVIGASMATGRVVSSGAVYVFHGTSSASGAYGWTQKAKLVAFDGSSNDFFGAAVGVYGNVIIVGAKEDSVHAVASGSAYLFSMNNALEWSFQSKIWANDSSSYDDFGVSVALWGDIAVVGADRAGGMADESGAVYVFSPGLIKQLYRGSDRLLQMSQQKFLMLLTALPLLLIVLPLLLFAVVWAFKKQAGTGLGSYFADHTEGGGGNRRGAMGMGMGVGDALTDHSSSVSEISSSPSVASPSESSQSTHGLVSNRSFRTSLHKNLQDHLSPRSSHRGVVMTASGESITPMIADQLRHSNLDSKALNEDLFS